MNGSVIPDRYKVVFTPVGWQVVDTQIARDPLYEFGTGDAEYRRAKDETARLNEDIRTHRTFGLRGEG